MIWGCHGVRGRNLLQTVLRAATLAGALMLGPAAARAEGRSVSPQELRDLTLEQLLSIEIETVEDLTGFLQKAAEAPASVSIVTANDVRRYGYRTLAEILGSVRGLYVSNDRNYSYLGTRGLSRPADYNTRILVLIDGHRLNDNVYDMAPIGTEFPIDVDLIQRVVVIRGPGSALFGSSAFFAIVNVITTTDHVRTGPEASVQLGDLDTRKGRVSYRRHLANGAGVDISVTGYGSAGQSRLYFAEFDSPETNHGVAENADRDRAGSTFGKVNFRDVLLSGAYQWRRKHIPTASFGTVFNSPQTQTLDRRGYVDLQYNHRFQSRLGVTARLYYDRYLYDADLMYAAPDGDDRPPVLNKEIGRGYWWGTELRVTRKFSPAHRVAGGAEYRGNLRQDQGNYDPNPFFAYLDDRRTSRIWALYLNDEIRLRPGLTLSAGLRHDHYDSFSGTTNPRLGLVYAPEPKTTLKILYGDAFRAPNLYELYYHSAGLKANPSLRPETIRSLEAVAERQIGNHVRLMVSGFHNRMENLISQLTDEVDSLSVFRNFERVRARGVEAEVAGTWDHGLQARLNYSLQHAEIDPGNMRPSNSPGQLVKFSLTTPLIVRRMTAGLDLQFMAARTSIAGNVVPAAWVANVTFLRRDLLDGLDASLSVYNALNSAYGYPGSEEHAQDVVYQDGRTALFRLTYRPR